MSATAPTREPAVTSQRDIRPFRIDVPQEAIDDLRRRLAATQLAREGDRPGLIPGRAARDDAEARAVLGDGLRLAQVRGEAERPAAVHYRDRWAGYPLHPRPLTTRRRAAAHRQSRMARLDHRAAEDHRATDRSHGPWRECSGRVPRCHPVDARLRVLRQADQHRLGSRAHGPRLGYPDVAPRLRLLRRPGR